MVLSGHNIKFRTIWVSYAILQLKFAQENSSRDNQIRHPCSRRERNSCSFAKQWRKQPFSWFVPIIVLKSTGVTSLHPLTDPLLARAAHVTAAMWALVRSRQLEESSQYCALTLAPSSPSKQVTNHRDQTRARWILTSLLQACILQNNIHVEHEHVVFDQSREIIQRTELSHNQCVCVHSGCHQRSARQPRPIAPGPCASHTIGKVLGGTVSRFGHQVGKDLRHGEPQTSSTSAQALIFWPLKVQALQLSSSYIGFGRPD